MTLQPAMPLFRGHFYIRGYKVRRGKLQVCAGIDYKSNIFGVSFIVNPKPSKMKRALFFTIALLIVAPAVNNFSNAALVIPASSAVPVSGEPAPSVVNSAVDGFKNLSKKEKKARVKEVKKEIKKFKAARKAGAEPSTNTLLLVILAILLPPLAVYLHQGEINGKFWISLLLTLLFWLPGVIYALIVILGNA